MHPSDLGYLNYPRIMHVEFNQLFIVFLDRRQRSDCATPLLRSTLVTSLRTSTSTEPLATYVHLWPSTNCARITSDARISLGRWHSSIRRRRCIWRTRPDPRPKPSPQSPTPESRSQTEGDSARRVIRKTRWNAAFLYAYPISCARVAGPNDTFQWRCAQGWLRLQRDVGENLVDILCKYVKTIWEYCPHSKMATRSLFSFAH